MVAGWFPIIEIAAWSGNPEPAPITIHVGGETVARLRRIAAIDGRSPEDLALQAIENEAAADKRGDLLRSA